MSAKKLFVLSGPAGAGEDSIIKGLKEKLNITTSITTTTRAMRDGESEGNPYHFISKDEFRAGIAKDEFFEWTEEDAGNLYGITHKEIERLKSGESVGIWKIDFNGVVTAKKLLGDEAVTIFVNCPLEQLSDRLRLRDNANEEFVKRRLEYAKGWFKIRDLFDYEVMNDDGNLEQSIEAVYNIIKENTKI